jgi:hypothetical protein
LLRPVADLWKRVMTTQPELQPDRKALRNFVYTMFRHAGSEGFASLRSFEEGATKSFRITTVGLEGGPGFLCEAAADDAYRAANALKPVVFCPPLAIFLYPDNAKQSNLLAGLALSVECDEHARNAVATLEQLLGPATAIVRSGGAWTDPETGQVEDKLHIHFRITGSARGPEALTKLKRARELATAIVGGDPTNVPIVHCIRWPGSYHRKDEPKLCAFEALNPDAEIDLDRALGALEAAAPEIKARANKKKANGKSRDGYAHGGDWARLIQEVLAAEAFHGPLVRLAMRLLKSGMNTGAAVNLLRGLMESADGVRNERWRLRYDDIGRAVDTAQEKLEPPKEEPPPACDLDKLHAIFRKWLGDEYDLEAIDTIVAVAASERLTGDPAWLLIISGPGAAKTESVQALAGCGALVTSTIQSEGALLSATSQKSRAKTATGGLLRKIGDRGIMVIKDVTSILSSDRNVREAVLAALREVHDGRWERNVGSDGGQSITWEGRIVIVGACTTAWDTAHGVVSTMGDRFVIKRIDSDTEAGRMAAGARALRNTGSEIRMRQELAKAVGGVVASANTDDIPLTSDENGELLRAANVVTRARTGVVLNYQGEVINAHAAEMPTRFAKQLQQIVRGGVAVGMNREYAMVLALGCARDSIPPLRREILLDIAKHPNSRPGDTRKRINKPWTTAKREMDALNYIGILVCDEGIETGAGRDGKDRTIFRYRLHPALDRKTLLAMAPRERPLPSPEM